MGLTDILFPTERIVTLDIGAKNVKVAQFSVKGKVLVLTHFEIFPTPRHEGKELSLKDPIMQDLLREIFVKNLKWTSRKKLYLGMPGASVLTKLIQVPKMDKAVVQEHIKFEASQYLPYDIDEANYDYIELFVLSKDPNVQSFFFIAVDKKNLAMYTSALTEIQVKIEAIDTDFFSLQRVYSRNQPKTNISKNENVLILDIGFQNIGFHVVRDCQIIFSRNILSGLHAYLEEIQNSLGVSEHEADSLLNAVCKHEDIPAEVFQVIQNYHPTFCREVSMGLEYFLNYFSNEKISKCCITGGGSDLPGLQEELSRRMEIKIKPLQVFRNIQTKWFSKKRLMEIQPFAGVCIGLALRIYDKLS